MARRLLYVPIEILEERYSKQWHEWFVRAFEKENIEFTVIGDLVERQIRTGQFLDVFDTNAYKAAQLSQIIKIISDNPDDEYIVFFMDMWFPGIESLGYLRSCANVKMKICGMLHAGTWDPHDFLAQKQMGKWAKGFEYSMLSLADEIYLASYFHLDLIEGYFNKPISHKVKIVPWPTIDPVPQDLSKKQNIVVFPHRLAPEKAPEEFDEIEKIFRISYPDVECKFIKSKDVCKTKADYYNLLSVSKVAVSTAKQETFGIAMVEANNYWCIPVVPDRLSYKEIFIERYHSLEGAAMMIYKALLNYNHHIFHFQFNSEIKWVKEILKWI